MVFVSQIKPKYVHDALCDDNWICAMQDELNQFTRNDVWCLVYKTSEMNVIETKWVFRNKMDEQGIIIERNKVRLVAKWHNQEKGIDYDETYALVTRLEAVRLLFAYACLHGFKLFQMDVKVHF